MSTLDELKRADGDVMKLDIGRDATPCNCRGGAETAEVAYKIACDDPNVPEERDCLKEADKIINGERQDSYGAPEDSFTIIAGYWNVFLAAKLKALGIDVKDLLTPLDTTNMMVLFKQARKLGQKPSRDNYVDSCGYEAIGADRLSE